MAVARSGEAILPALLAEPRQQDPLRPVAGQTEVLDADSLPAVRDRCLAPSLLMPFADDMARRLARLSTGPLLEVAADTGVLTQAIAASMSAGLAIVATDPCLGRVQHAAEKPGMARVTWQQADPVALPFGDAIFGIVTCHFAFAGMTDRISAFRETRRVLKPAGRFVFSVPGAIRHNPVAGCLQAALEALFPDDPPGFISNDLHGYANTEAIDDDLTEAGFTDAIYTTVELPYAADSAADAAVGYCLGTGLRTAIESRTNGHPAPVVEAVAQALRRQFGSGPLQSTMRAQIVSACG